MVTERPVIDSRAKLWTSCHVVPDRWVLESNAGDTGGAYRWLLDLLFGSAGGEAHAAAEATMTAAGAAETPPRPLFCHLGPAIFNLRDMNPFKAAGLLFRFPLLHVDRPDRGEILRAYLESVAFAIRGNCEQIQTVSGRPIALLSLSGGMTRSPTLAAILASTLRVPVAVATVPESASLGSAILAAVGAGLHRTLTDAVHEMTCTLQVDPDPGGAAAYDERYGRWRELYDRLQGWTL
jgi:sugar (pentulose or hexulose) kinase